ncbi:MAG: ATP-binding protein [Actinomycetota bacterium]|nr:ATP-binding protein [Actinomycetota bacterium]
MTGIGAPPTELIERGMASVVADAMESARAVALLGPRQAGKSTLAQVLAGGRVPADYLTLDDDPVRSAARADPQGFVAALGRRTVIDEVQRAPDLLLAVKSRLDRDRSPGQFLLTGSANLRRVPGVADALPGRLDYLTLWPLTQGEIAGRYEDVLQRAFDGDIPSIVDAPVGRHEYAEMLVAGGFPEARMRSPAARMRFFTSYVGSIVDRDVADVARVQDPTAVGTLLRLVAARSGALARYETLARDAALDGKTVKSHLDVLERLFLVRIRRPWHVNLGKRQVKAPKLYMADSGLLAGMLGAGAGRVRDDDGLAGALFETFVATELERQASWSPQPLTFWHYREGEREVDTIVEWPSGEIVGVEVKASATVRARDFTGLAHLRDRVGARLRAGLVVYAGQRTLPFGNRLWALPLRGLWRP